MKRKFFSAFVAWGFYAIYSGLYIVYDGPYTTLTPDDLLWVWVMISIVSAIVILGVGVPVSLLSDWVTRKNLPFRRIIAFMIHAGFMIALMPYTAAGYRIVSVQAFMFLMIAIVFWAADEYYRKKWVGAQ